jgi:hypothetical protein
MSGTLLPGLLISLLESEEQATGSPMRAKESKISKREAYLL